MSRVTVFDKGLKFEGHVDDAKSIAEALADVEDKVVSDFRFQLEVAYQNYYGLDQDNWERVSDETGS